jgi:hypothetical protein
VTNQLRGRESTSSSTPGAYVAVLNMDVVVDPGRLRRDGFSTQSGAGAACPLILLESELT